MSWLFFLLLSCAGKKPLNHETARDLFSNSELCVDQLKRYMMKSHCPELSYTQATPYDIMIRCFKPDSHRGEFWDNYIFRISSKDLQYASDKDLELIQSHTICLDDYTRIEAYPPSSEVRDGV